MAKKKSDLQEIAGKVKDAVDSVVSKVEKEKDDIVVEEKQRTKESREKIPGGSTDFWDREHKFHDGFKTGREKGDQPQFTEEGLDHYNTEKAELTTPESFNT